MDRLEAIANWLSDRDWLWWPLLSLRPPRDRPMTNRMVFQLSLLGSMLIEMLIGMMLVAGGSRLSREWVTSLVLTGLLTPLAVFLTYRLTFAWCWNRRAARSVSSPPP
jgi:hypothetical protein